jgi:hypothetical protein
LWLPKKLWINSGSVKIENIKKSLPRQIEEGRRQKAEGRRFNLEGDSNPS